MSARNIWLRILAGTCRDGVYYWFSTRGPAPGADPAWVAASTPIGGTSQWLPIQTVPQIQSGSVDPLEPLASGGRISVVVQSSEAVRAIVAQTLGTSVEARRVGGLAAYAGPSETIWTVTPGTDVSVGDYLVLSGEIVRVTDVGSLGADPPKIEVSRAQLGTWARGHASSLGGLGTPIVSIDSAQIVGQWAELGVTDGGVDRVVWRGRVRSASASSDQTVSIHIDSLLSVVRDHRPLVPVLFPEARPSDSEDDGGAERREIRATLDPGDLPPTAWRYVRVVGESGDWALLGADTQEVWDAAVTVGDDGVVTIRWGDTPAEPSPGGLYIVEVGSSDGIIRFDGVGQIRYPVGVSGRTGTEEVDLRSTLLEEFFRLILAGIDRIEWATVVPDLVTFGAAGDVVSSLSPVSALAYVLAGAGAGVAPLPARFAVWTPPLFSGDEWLAWQPAVELIEVPSDSSVPDQRLRVFDPRGRLGEYLADTLLHPLGLCLSDDAGLLRLFSWVEAVRPDSGRAYDTTSGDDRSAAWSWSTDRSPIVATVQIEDPSRDVFVLRSLGTRRRGSSFGGGREDRTVSGRVKEIVSIDSLISGSGGAYELVSPYGVGGDVDAQWESAAGLYSGRIPVLECDVADAPVDDVWVCTQLLVEYPELPTPERTTGWVFACRRDLLTGVARLTVLLPFVGLGERTGWGPWATVDSAGVSSAVIESPSAGVAPHSIHATLTRDPTLTTLLVLRPDLTTRGTITGVTSASETAVAWTGGTAPEAGDYLVLPARPGVVGSPTPIGSVYGYVCGGSVETGDATWQ